MTTLETTAREVLVINSKPGAPIACDMTGASDTPQARLAEYARLFGAALVGRKRSGNGTEFSFSSREGVEEWIADLVRREAACCPFFSYRVTVEGDRIIWHTSSAAGAEAQAMLDELHALPDHCAEGLDEYFERLAQRGVFITSPAPGRFRIQDRGADGQQRLLRGKEKSSCGC
jgi:hypothetical protein